MQDRIVINWKRGGGGAADTIKIVVSQKKEKLEKIYGIKEIGPGKYVDINLSNFEPGKVSVTIEGDNLSKDSEMWFSISNDTSFGHIVKDGELTDNSLFMKLSFKYKMFYTNFQIVCMIISIMVLLIAVKYINSEEENPKICFKLWICSVIIIFMQIVLKYPMLMFAGAPYYETATLYFGTTYQDGINSILVGDMGYLPMFQRIIVFIIVLLFRQDRFALIFMQISAGIIVSIICAMFNLYYYSKYFNKQIRFLITIIIGATQLIIMNEQLISFLNFSYFGIILIVFIYMIDMEKVSNGKFGLILLSSLIVFSKATMIVLLPVLFLAALMCKKRNKKKAFVYSISLIINLLLQVFYILFFSKSSSTLNLDNLISNVIHSVYNFFVIIANFIFKGEIVENNGFVILSFCLFLFIALFIWMKNLLKRGHKKTVFITSALLSTAYLSCVMDAFSVQYFNYSIGDISIFNIAEFHFELFYKNIFFIMTFLFFIMIYLLDEIYKKYSYKVCTIFLILIAIKGLLIVPYIESPTNRADDWLSYSKCMKMEYYAIPINLDGAFFADKADILYCGNQDPLNAAGYAHMESSIPTFTLDSLSNISEYNLEKRILDRDINAIYTKKVCLSQTNNIYAIFYNVDGEEIYRCKVEETKGNKTGIAFILEHSVSGVAQIKFEDISGSSVMLAPEMYIVARNYNLE